MSILSMLTCYINSQTTDFKVWENCICQEVERENYILVGSLAAEKSWMAVFCQEKQSKYIAEIQQENMSKETKNGEVLLLKMRVQSSSFIFAGVNCRTYEDYMALFD